MRTAILTIFVGCCATTAITSNAAVYYVAKNGNDSNPGSAASPWLTIGKAASVTATGDTVRVQPGTYDEAVTESTDGAPLAKRITYVADGAVVVRRFVVRGDYVRIIGFEVTHTSHVGYEAFNVDGATGVEILDNYIHETSHNGYSGGISYGNSTNLVVRGNRFYRCGTRDPAGKDSEKKAIGEIYNKNDSRNVLIEYNVISRVSEYINPAGSRHIVRNNVFGPTTTNDFSGIPHVDGVQPNGEWQNSFMESNWHVENPVNDSHLYLDEGSGTYHVVILRNVSIRSGDVLVNQWRLASLHRGAHQVFAQTGCGPSRRISSSHGFLVWDSTNNVSRNNIFTNTTTDSTPYGYVGTWQLTHDHDLNNSNPGWQNYGARILTPTANSPAVNAAGALTTTTSVGANTSSVTLADAYWFHDGFGMTRGHSIYVGTNNNLTVTNVDWSARRVFVDCPISFKSGDNVGLSYRGTGPDIGAYEYGDALLTAATLATNATSQTATTSGDTRFVVFYQNGIPHTTVFNPPFTVAISGGAVTAKAFALHPQSTPVLQATISPVQRPEPPRALRVLN